MLTSSLLTRSLNDPEILSGDQLSADTLDPPDQLMHVSISQVLLQPSLSAVFPSSHSLPPRFLPSPQSSTQVSLFVVVPPEHANPVSTVHVELHPSPSALFPSSQSAVLRFPSPHISEQM